MLTLFQIEKEEFEGQTETEKEVFWRSYLYERKEVKKEEVWEMKKSKELNFKTAGQILNELCVYDESTDSFKYNSL